MFNWRAQCVGISREGFTVLFEGEFQNKQEEIIKNPAYLSRKFPSFVSPVLGQAVFSPLNLFLPQVRLRRHLLLIRCNLHRWQMNRVVRAPKGRRR